MSWGKNFAVGLFSRRCGISLVERGIFEEHGGDEVGPERASSAAATPPSECPTTSAGRLISDSISAAMSAA